MKTSFARLLPILTGLALQGASAQTVDLAQRTEELKNLRWGMFICWSFSTFSGKEWTPGITNIDLFQPTGCDTDQWARTAKDAGMGYILFLTKHHDGFCLWDTATTDRKVTKSRLGRDVLRQLRQSCDRFGIKLALYFSEGEWAWPDKPDGTRFSANGGYCPEMKKAQLKELCTRYGPIEYFWMDHAVGDGGLSHEETVKWVKSFQPGCFVGFNHGPPAGDIRLGEMGHPTALSDPSGAGFNSGQMTGYGGYRLAEFTYPILPAHQGGAMWFYSLPKHDQLCCSAERLYDDYLGAVRFGNIFSIDAGPDYAGRLREIDVQTLTKVGKYIRREIAPPPTPVSRHKAARASTTWSGTAEFAAAAALDGDAHTRWGAGQGTRSGWLEVDLGKPVRVARSVVDEGQWDRVREFEIQAEQGGTWRTVARGTTLGPTREILFPAVEAQRFRLNILRAVEVPTICEFELFETQ